MHLFKFVFILFLPVCLLAQTAGLKGTVADDPEILGKGVGAGLRKGEDELKGKINAAIKQIREDGTYDAITAKYFAMSIYGN